MFEDTQYDESSKQLDLVSSINSRHSSIRIDDYIIGKNFSKTVDSAAILQNSSVPLYYCQKSE